MSAWLCILLAIVAASASAQSLSLEVVPGFDGVCPSGGCYPVTVWIRGQRPDAPPIVAEVRIDASSLEGRSFARQTVALPSGEVAIPLSFTLCHPPSIYSAEVSAQLWVGNKLSAASKASTATFAFPHLLVVGLGVERSAVTSIDKQSFNLFQVGDRLYKDIAPWHDIGSSITLIGRVRYSLPPDRAVAYRGVSAVSLDDRSWDALTEDQQRALKDYVWSGGLLVVHGVDLNQLRTLLPSGLLPVEPLGVTRVAANALRRWMPTLTAETLDIVQVRPLRGAKVLLREGRYPLVVSGRYGWGQVVFLAFDPTQPVFMSSAVACSLWQKLLNLHVGRFSVPGVIFPSRSAAKGENDFAPDASQVQYLFLHTLVQSLWGEPIPLRWITTYLAIYVLGLIPLNYLLLRRLDRLHLSWLTLPLIAIGMTIGAYVLAHRTHLKTSHVRQWSVFYLRSGSPYAMVESDLAIYNARSKRYSLRSHIEGCLVDNSPVTLQASRIEETPQHSPPRLQQVSVPVWSPRTFHLSGTTTLPGTIEVSARHQGTEVVIDVFNRMPYPIRSMIIVWPHRYYMVIDERRNDISDIQVPPGGAWRVVYLRHRRSSILGGQVHGDKVDRSDEPWLQVASDYWRDLCALYVQSSSFHDLDKVIDRIGTPTPRPSEGILIATAETEIPLIGITPAEGLQQETVTLMVVHFEVQ